MTYKARFEQLLLISIQKSNAFLAIVKAEGQSGSAQFITAQATWEAAQKDYVSFLELMESGLIDPDDRIRPLRKTLKARVKDMAALFFELADTGVKGDAWSGAGLLHSIEIARPIFVIPAGNLKSNTE